jgi:hypothetical protein
MFFFRIDVFSNRITEVGHRNGGKSSLMPSRARDSIMSGIEGKGKKPTADLEPAALGGQSLKKNFENGRIRSTKPAPPANIQ